MRWFVSLRRSADIAQVRRRGRRFNADTLSAFVLENRSAPSRVAVTVSKSVGGAVARNRTKRRIKGALDALGPTKSPVRLVFIARPGAAGEPYGRLARDVAAAFERLDLRP